MKYIIESFEKFRKDALSKILYDFLKYLFLTFVVVFFLKYIPVDKQFLLEEIKMSLWQLLLLLIFSVIIIFIFYSIKFNSAFRKIKLESQIDDLTGIKNHKALDEALNKIFSDKIVKEDFPISLILFDIDNFKSYNEKYGFDTSDQIFSKLGELLKRDSRISDEVFRYFFRGDEFLIIAKKTNLSNGINAADRKRKLIEETNFVIGDQEYHLTSCCGVTEIIDSDNKAIVLERLNKALLKAKTNIGKNKTEAFM